MKDIPLSQSRTGELCRGFALLLHAGVGLADCARLLSREEEDDSALLRDLTDRLDQGLPLWEAMERTGAFAASVTGMVRVGEETGRLEEALEGLADYCEESVRSRRQLKNAVAWPAMLLVLMLLVIGVLLVEVMPVFDAVYASLGARLTGLSAGLLALGQLLRAALPALLGALALTALTAGLLALFPSLGSRWAALWRSRFGDRGIPRKFNNARFARALAMTLGSGLPLEEGLALCQGLLAEQPGAVSRVRRCRELLAEGSLLADAMEETELLPPSRARLLTAGLKGGNADRVMEDIARRMEEEARQALEDAVSGMEPAMVLTASALVGIILLSAMLPLMNIMTAMG